MFENPKNDNTAVQGGGVDRAEPAQGEFCFELPQRVNAYPDPRRLPGRVLAILLAGRRYTHRDAWLELGHSRLSDSVWKLRRLGWPVQMVEETVKTSDCGRPATIGIYFLESDAIKAAGPQGQAYIGTVAEIEEERRAA